jgi:hypothetical protein
MAVVHKVSEGKSILVRIATCEALVSHVKEAIQIPFLRRKKKERKRLATPHLKSKREREETQTFASLEISFHWSGVGSTPVGLWAQA